ncbi:MAG: histidine phosphatase family protein [Proteobacteria bacterium]|nr:histidine phosphatase family protein [Pseudomonadota bacterium]
MPGVRIYLVRHGQASGKWDTDVDPGLDETGRRQARAMADDLAGLGPLPILASPMRRTRETAAPLEALWSNRARIEPAVSEIPSPSTDLAERSAWLRRAMLGTWAEMDPEYLAWRGSVLQALIGIDRDTVVVSHYIAINAAVGRAIGDDRLICFHPDNCSVTTLELADNGLHLVELGRQTATDVL